MSWDRLVFGWLTIVCIFGAAFYLFWPDISRKAIRETGQLVKTAEKKIATSRKMAAREEARKARSLKSRGTSAKADKMKLQPGESFSAVWINSKIGLTRAYLAAEASLTMKRATIKLKFKF